MKRSSPLKRKTRMSRASAALTRRSPLRARSRTSDYDAAAWREGLGPCVVTGAFVDVDPHHVIYAQTLRKHGLHAYLADHRNRLALARDVHLNHHSGADPLPRELLPACVFEFAAEVGLTWWLTRHYVSSCEAVAA